MKHHTITHQELILILSIPVLTLLFFILLYEIVKKITNDNKLVLENPNDITDRINVYTMLIDIYINHKDSYIIRSGLCSAIRDITGKTLTQETFPEIFIAYKRIVGLSRFSEIGSNRYWFPSGYNGNTNRIKLLVAAKKIAEKNLKKQWG